MSSSQQQQDQQQQPPLPPSSNDSSNTQSQIPQHNMYSDYDEDSWLPPNVASNNSNNDSSNVNTNGDDQQYYGNDYYPVVDDVEYDLDDETLEAVEKEMDEAQNLMQNVRLNDNNNDYDVFSDDVQRAFESYENENAKNWQRSDSEEIMFNEMRECMRYLSQEYSMAEMPTPLVDLIQESVLNPDAAEFRPSWASPTTTTNDNGIIVVKSWAPCKAEKFDETK